VSEDVLKLIVQTFDRNGGSLEIVTTYGIDVPEPIADIDTKPGWLGF
jgi:hypothetical protein